MLAIQWSKQDRIIYVFISVYKYVTRHIQPGINSVILISHKFRNNVAMALFIRRASENYFLEDLNEI